MLRMAYLMIASALEQISQFLKYENFDEFGT